MGAINNMAIAKNPKVIMTSEEFLTRLKNLAGRPNYYSNKWPDNLCYIHKGGKTSADCVNLVKAILNGYNIYNNEIGYYQKDLSNTGDCTELQLLEQCSEVTNNFKNMGNKARILWMNKPNSHIGVYLGQEVTIDGKVYNVIESSKSWGGIVYSYVDSDGTRRRYKGSVKNCQWMKNGLPDKWVDFSAQNGPNSQEKPKDYKSIAQEVIAGKWGNGGVRRDRLKAAGYTLEEIAKIQSLVNELCKKPQASAEIWHTVKSGEVASVIAKKYNVSLESIKKLNPTVKNWNLIYPNQRIRIK